jgi:UDP-N-acetylbacillosamine N-acetyltransferase
MLYGAGGHGRSVLEVLTRAGLHTVAAVLDDAPGSRREFCGIPIRGGEEAMGELLQEGLRDGFVAIGDNQVRRRLSLLWVEGGGQLVNIVDPHAVIAREIPIGPGTVLMPGVMVDAASSVGQGCILNTSCTVAHDCLVEDFAHLSAGVNVSGGCTVGEAATLGIGCTVARGARVGRRSTVGAGAAVIGDVPDDAVAIGVPARVPPPRPL